MSPTIFREDPYRGFLFSREKPRIHVQSADGETKLWLEPRIELAANFGLPRQELGKIKELIERHEHEIRQERKWYFSGDR